MKPELSQRIRNYLAKKRPKKEVELEPEIDEGVAGCEFLQAWEEFRQEFKGPLYAINLLSWLIITVAFSWALVIVNT